MRRITLSLLVVFAFFCNHAQAQLEVVFTGNPTVMSGGQVSVDVSVNNFDNLFGVQFSMNWDSLVLNYNSVTNIVPNSILPDVSAASIGDPSALGVDPGQATFSWFPFSGVGQTVPDGTILFTLVFDGTGEACSSTSIVLSDDPRIIEVSVDDGANTDIGAVSSGIALEIFCPPMGDCGPNMGNTSCTTGTPGGLGIIGSDELAASGENVCMEVTVENFTDVQSMEMNMVWPAGLLNYDTVTNFCPDVLGLGASNFNFIGDMMGNDTLRLVWFDFSASNPATLPDGKVLFEVCYDAVGPNGSFADISFLDTEFGDSNQQTIADFTDCGSVEICIADPGMTQVDLFADDVTFVEGEAICIPIRADDFTDIQSFQFTIDWIDNVFQFGSIQNIHPDLTPDPVFNDTDPGILPLNWFNSAGVTLPDGAILFEVCLDFVGDCTNPASNNSFISFIDQPGFEIEFGDINDMAIDMVTTDGANVSIDCPDCDVMLSVSNPDCPGETGSILVSGGEMPYQSCDWSFNGDNSFDPGGCNVFAGIPGNYTVTVVDANGQICDLTATIVNPDPINFTPVVSNITCNDLGTVTVPPGNISGGSGGFMIDFNPAGPYMTATTVTVTVTDTNDCSESVVVTVGDEVVPPSVMSANATGSCSNNDGEIVVTILDGCPPFSATGGVASGNVVIFSNLPAGNFGPIDITDSRGNVVSVGPEMVPFFDAVTASVSVTDASFGGMDGIIDLGLMGGAMPYTILINPNAGNATGANGDIFTDLPPGDYSFSITDANGCTLDLGPINVAEEDDDPPVIDTIEIDIIITSEAEFNGWGVSCNGACDGSVVASTSEVNGSLTSIVLTDGDVVINDLSATDLCPGDYTLTVVDSLGVTETANFTISQPDQLVATLFATECDSVGMNTGSIEISVSGGTPDYIFDWSNGADTQNISSLAAGDYSVMVTDENGCLDTVMNTTVEACTDPTGDGCYTAANIMTPGGSIGANDFLSINCAGDNPNTLNIYDRWGRLVNGFTDYDNSWNGVDMDGNELGEGTYFWVLETTFPTGEIRLFKGSVTLLRDI
jgi:gliding motility-associated-like protein